MSESTNTDAGEKLNSTSLCYTGHRKSNTKVWIMAVVNAPYLSCELCWTYSGTMHIFTILYCSFHKATNSSDSYVLVSSTYSTRLYSDTKQRYSMWQWQGQEALKEEGTDRRRNLCCLLGLFVLDKSTDRGRIDRPHRESMQQRPQHLQAKISVTQRSEDACVRAVCVNWQTWCMRFLRVGRANNLSSI